MNRPTNPNAPLSLDTPIDEDRVRRALGLKSNGPHQQRPEQARQRHRFVADGAVPVVMLNRVDGETNGLKERVAGLEAQLEAERAAHAATRRTLADAQASNQALQTRAGHTELSHSEAIKREREARRTAEEALSALRAEHMQPTRPMVGETPAVAALRPGRKPRAVAAPKEQKPVRWWTPSFRSKKR